MALILCPECGKSVSSKASHCPSCGCPLSQEVQQAPPAPLVQPQSVSSPQNSEKIEVVALTCHHCGESLSAKDFISGEWARCPHCGTENYIRKPRDTKNIFEGILHPSFTADTFLQKVANWLMHYAPKDVFDTATINRPELHYFWVREFGPDQNRLRAIVPLCKYGQEVIGKINHGLSIAQSKSRSDSKNANQEEAKTATALDYILNGAYDQCFPLNNILTFANKYPEAIIHPRELDDMESARRFSNTKHGHLRTNSYYYCLPVYECKITYKGKTYTFVSPGTGREDVLYVDAFPKDPVLVSEPNYTHIMPFCTVAGIILGIAIIIFIISCFSKGFWSGLFELIIVGVILYVVGLIVGVPVFAILAGLDMGVQKSINAGRSKSFKDKWRSVQDYKKASASRRFRWNLNYEVPPFPF